MNRPGGPIGNELEIRSLRYFVAAAEELNFTRAAARLYVAQQALSREIQRLEARLGTPLFQRTTRRVTLTPDGERLLVRLEPLSVLLPAEHPLARRETVPVGSLRGIEVDGLPPHDEAPEWDDLVRQFFALSGAHSTPPHLPAVGLEEQGYHLVRQGVPILTAIDHVEARRGDAPARGADPAVRLVDGLAPPQPEGGACGPSRRCRPRRDRRGLARESRGRGRRQDMAPRARGRTPGERRARARHASVIGC